MPGTVSRREMLQGLLAAGVALGAEWPALAQSEELVPFTDLPAPAAGRVPPSLQNFFTPSDEFFEMSSTMPGSAWTTRCRPPSIRRPTRCV